MSDILFWHDSEVWRVIPPSDTDRASQVILSAAAMARDGVAGYLKPLELVFVQATLSGPVPECLGSIAEGACQTAGGTQRQLTLPWHCDGPLQLRLQFRNGSVLLIDAASAYCTPSAEARFLESYAC